MTRKYYVIEAVDKLRHMQQDDPIAGIITMGIALLYQNKEEDANKLQGMIMELVYQQPNLKPSDVVNAIEERHMHTDRKMVVDVVGEVTNVPIKDILSKSRVRKVSDARKLCYKYLREHMGLGLVEISVIMNRTHGSILEGVRSINGHIESGDNKLISDWGKIVETIELEKI